MGKWIEAMRLRTLPVSISGVLAGIACAMMGIDFSLVPALLCLLFAILAQIASNFANEYYDFRKGVDRKGREGFRRGVTEGDITPAAMKYATFSTLAAAAVVGCLMLFYGSWWLVPIGLCIGLFALAYSAGPYPLSHHGLGDVAVVIFFGIVPVTLTCYLQQGGWRELWLSLPISVAVGLLAANVLIVNNCRDEEDDRAVGKRTTVVIFGRKAMGWVGEWEHYMPYWSINSWQTDCKEYVNSLNFGNRFLLGNLTLDLEYMTRAASTTKLFKDNFNVMVAPAYKISDRLKVLGKFGWEYVAADLPYELAYEEYSGGDYYHYGGGVEFYPFKDVEGVRLHAIWAGNNFGDSYLYLGFRWNFNLTH